jgi:hypothetical protein
MASNDDDGLSVIRVPPSVSKDKYIQLAVGKLERGWVIVLGDKGKNANFFKPGQGFGPIMLSVAKKLIELGLITEDGRHPLGRRFVLSKDADKSAAVIKVPIVDDDDDDDDDDSTEYDSLDIVDSEDVESEDDSDETD